MMGCVPVPGDLSASTVIAVPIPINGLPDGERQRLDALFRTDPLLEQLDAELLEWHPGTAIVRATIQIAHTNFLGGGHGGVLFSLGDLAMSFASNGYGRQAVATHIDISYHRGVQPGDLVTANVTEISRTRRFGHYRVELMVSDRLVASATGTTYRTDDWHFGTNQWSEEWRAKH